MFSVVLLAAGSGSRMLGANGAGPKCLMPTGSGTVLSEIVEGILTLSPQKICIVGGYGADQLQEYIDGAPWRNSVTMITNSKYSKDRNIFSALLGQRKVQGNGGILFVETDTYLAPAAWKVISAGLAQGKSFICVSQSYSRENTGGYVITDEHGRVTEVGYQPKFTHRLEGADRMAGLFFVAAEEVTAEQELREKAVKTSIDDYYFASLIGCEKAFDFRTVTIHQNQIGAFNTRDEYTDTLDRVGSPKLGS